MGRTRSPEREDKQILTFVERRLQSATSSIARGNERALFKKSNPREDDKREIGMIQDCF
jgi:hypothetical protein